MMTMVRLLIGLAARLVVLAAFVIIVGDAVLTYWERGAYVMAVIVAGVFPATVFLWPWQHEAFGYSLIWVFGAAVVAYPISTLVGGFDPI